MIVHNLQYFPLHMQPHLIGSRKAEYQAELLEGPVDRWSLHQEGSHHYPGPQQPGQVQPGQLLPFTEEAQGGGWR